MGGQPATPQPTPCRFREAAESEESDAVPNLALCTPDPPSSLRAGDPPLDPPAPEPPGRLPLGPACVSRAEPLTSAQRARARVCGLGRGRIGGPANCFKMCSCLAVVAHQVKTHKRGKFGPHGNSFHKSFVRVPVQQAYHHVPCECKFILSLSLGCAMLLDTNVNGACRWRISMELV